jgi:hypothetical protein
MFNRGCFQHNSKKAEPMNCPHCQSTNTSQYQKRTSVVEMFLVRGYELTHETVRDWEARFAPLLNAQLRAKRHGQAGKSWYADETYVKVKGEWQGCEESAFPGVLPPQTLLVQHYDVVQDKLPVLHMHLAHLVAKREQVMRAHHHPQLRDREIQFLQQIDHRDQADEQIAVPESDAHVIPGHGLRLFCYRAHRG